MRTPRPSPRATQFPARLVELALAHINSDRVEGAYRRGDLFKRRRMLKQQWADYASVSA